MALIEFFNIDSACVLIANMPINKERSKCSHSREITQGRHANMFIFESVKPGKKEVLKNKYKKKRKMKTQHLCCQKQR